MANKKINLSILLFFIVVSVVLISIEISSHVNQINHTTIDGNNLQIPEEKSTDSLVYEIGEGEIQLPIDLKE